MLDKVSIRLVRDSDGQTYDFGYYSDWVFIKNSLSGFSEVNNTLTVVESAIRDGGMVTNERVASKQRSFEVAYTKPNRNEWERRELVSFLSIKDTYKCYVTYGDMIVWQSCRIYKMKLGISARIRRTLHLTLTLQFEDPYWNSYDDFGKNIAALEPLIAFPFLCALDHDYGLDIHGERQYGPIGTTGARFLFAPLITVDNDGEAETYCRAVIKANGRILNPKFIINDGYIRVLDTLSKDDEVEIDMQNMPPTVKKNGVNWIGHCDRTSTFTTMVLHQGNNTIGFSADEGESNMEVYIYYNKKYEAV